MFPFTHTHTHNPHWTEMKHINITGLVGTRLNNILKIIYEVEVEAED